MDLNSNGKDQSGQNLYQHIDDLRPNRAHTGITENFLDSDFRGADKNVPLSTEPPPLDSRVVLDTDCANLLLKKQTSGRIDLRSASVGSVPGTAEEDTIENKETNNYPTTDISALNTTRRQHSTTLINSLKNNSPALRYGTATTNSLTPRDSEREGINFANDLHTNPLSENVGFRDGSYDHSESFNTSGESSSAGWRSPFRVVSIANDDAVLSEIGEYTWTETKLVSRADEGAEAKQKYYYPEKIFFEETVITYFPEHERRLLDKDSGRSVSGEQVWYRETSAGAFNGHSSSPQPHADMRRTLHTNASEIWNYDTRTERSRLGFSVTDNKPEVSLPRSSTPDFDENLVVYSREKGMGGENVHVLDSRKDDRSGSRLKTSGNDWRSDSGALKDGYSSDRNDVGLAPPFSHYPVFAERQTTRTHPQYTTDNTRSFTDLNSIAFIDSIEESSRQKVTSRSNVQNRMEQDAHEGTSGTRNSQRSQRGGRNHRKQMTRSKELELRRNDSDDRSLSDDSLENEVLLTYAKTRLGQPVETLEQQRETISQVTNSSTTERYSTSEKKIRGKKSQLDMSAKELEAYENEGKDFLFLSEESSGDEELSHLARLRKYNRQREERRTRQIDRSVPVRTLYGVARMAQQEDLDMDPCVGQPESDRTVVSAQLKDNTGSETKVRLRESDEVNLSAEQYRHENIIFRELASPETIDGSGTHSEEEPQVRFIMPTTLGETRQLDSNSNISHQDAATTGMCLLASERELTDTCFPTSSLVDRIANVVMNEGKERDVSNEYQEDIWLEISAEKPILRGTDSTGIYDNANENSRTIIKTTKQESHTSVQPEINTKIHQQDVAIESGNDTPLLISCFSEVATHINDIDDQNVEYSQEDVALEVSTHKDRVSVNSGSGIQFQDKNTKDALIPRSSIREDIATNLNADDIHVEESQEDVALEVSIHTDQGSVHSGSRTQFHDKVTKDALISKSSIRDDTMTNLNADDAHDVEQSQEDVALEISTHKDRISVDSESRIQFKDKDTKDAVIPKSSIRDDVGTNINADDTQDVEHSQEDIALEVSTHKDQVSVLDAHGERRLTEFESKIKINERKNDSKQTNVEGERDRIEWHKIKEDEIVITEKREVHFNATQETDNNAEKWTQEEVKIRYDCSLKNDQQITDGERTRNFGTTKLKAEEQINEDKLVHGSVKVQSNDDEVDAVHEPKKDARAVNKKQGNEGEARPEDSTELSKAEKLYVEHTIHEELKLRGIDHSTQKKEDTFEDETTNYQTDNVNVGHILTYRELGGKDHSSDKMDRHTDQRATEVQQMKNTFTDEIEKPVQDAFTSVETKSQTSDVAKEELEDSVTKGDKKKRRRRPKKEQKKTQTTKTEDNVHLLTEEQTQNTVSNFETQSETVQVKMDEPKNDAVNNLVTKADNRTIDDVTDESQATTETKVAVNIFNEITDKQKQDRVNNLETKADTLILDAATEELLRDNDNTLETKTETETVKKKPEESKKDTIPTLKTQAETLNETIELKTQDTFNSGETKDKTFQEANEDLEDMVTSKDKKRRQKRRKKEQNKTQNTKQVENVHELSEDKTKNTDINLETQPETVQARTEGPNKDTVNDKETKVDSQTVDEATVELREETVTSEKAKVVIETVEETKDDSEKNGLSKSETKAATSTADAVTEELRDANITVLERNVETQFVDKPKYDPDKDRISVSESNADTVAVDAAAEEQVEDENTSLKTKSETESAKTKTEESKQNTITAVETPAETLNKTIHANTQDTLSNIETLDETIQEATEDLEDIVTKEDKRKVKRREKKEQNKTQERKQADNVQVSIQEEKQKPGSSLEEQSETVKLALEEPSQGRINNLETKFDTLTIDAAIEDIEDTVSSAEAQLETKIFDITSDESEQDRICHLETRVDSYTVNAATEELIEDTVTSSEVNVAIRIVAVPADEPEQDRIGQLETRVDSYTVNAATEELIEDTVTSPEAHVAIRIVAVPSDEPEQDRIRNVETKVDTQTVDRATEEQLEDNGTRLGARIQEEIVKVEEFKQDIIPAVKTLAETVKTTTVAKIEDTINSIETQDESLQQAIEDLKGTVSKEKKWKIKRREKNEKKKMQEIKQMENVQLSTDEENQKPSSRFEAQSETIKLSTEELNQDRVNNLETKADTRTFDESTEDINDDTVTTVARKEGIEIVDATTDEPVHNRISNSETKVDSQTVNTVAEEQLEDIDSSSVAMTDDETVKAEELQQDLVPAANTSAETVKTTIEVKTQDTLNSVKTQDESLQRPSEDLKDEVTKEDKRKLNKRAKKEQKKTQGRKQADEPEQDRTCNVETRVDSTTLNTATEQLIEDTVTSSEANVPIRIVDVTADDQEQDRISNLETKLDIQTVDRATKELIEDNVTSLGARTQEETVKAEELKQDLVPAANTSAQTVKTTIEVKTQDTLISVETQDESLQPPSEDLKDKVTKEDKRKLNKREKKERKKTQGRKQANNVQLSTDEENQTPSSRFEAQSENLKLSTEELNQDKVNNLETKADTRKVDESTEDISDDTVTIAERKVGIEIVDETTDEPAQVRTSNVETRVDSRTLNTATEVLIEDTVTSPQANVAIRIVDVTTDDQEQDRISNLETKLDTQTVDRATEEQLEDNGTSLGARTQEETVKAEDLKQDLVPAANTSAKSVKTTIEVKTQDTLNSVETQDESLQRATEDLKDEVSKEDKRKLNKREKKERKKTQGRKQADNVQLSTDEENQTPSSRFEAQSETLKLSTEELNQDRVNNLETKADTRKVDESTEDINADTVTIAERKVEIEIVDETTDEPEQDRTSNVETRVDSRTLNTATEELIEDTVTSYEANVAIKIVDVTTDDQVQDRISNLKTRVDSKTVNAATEYELDDNGTSLRAMTDTETGTAKVEETKQDLILTVNKTAESVNRTTEVEIQESFNSVETQDATEDLKDTLTKEDKKKTKRREKKEKKKIQERKQADNVHVSTDEDKQTPESSFEAQPQTVQVTREEPSQDRVNNSETNTDTVTVDSATEEQMEDNDTRLGTRSPTETLKARTVESKEDSTPTDEIPAENVNKTTEVKIQDTFNSVETQQETFHEATEHLEDTSTKENRISKLVTNADTLIVNLATGELTGETSTSAETKVVTETVDVTTDEPQQDCFSGAETQVEMHTAIVTARDRIEETDIKFGTKPEIQIFKDTGVNTQIETRERAREQLKQDSEEQIAANFYSERTEVYTETGLPSRMQELKQDTTETVDITSSQQKQDTVTSLQPEEIDFIRVTADELTEAIVASVETLAETETSQARKEDTATAMQSKEEIDNTGATIEGTLPSLQIKVNRELVDRMSLEQKDIVTTMQSNQEINADDVATAILNDLTKLDADGGEFIAVSAGNVVWKMEHIGHINNSAETIADSVADKNADAKPISAIALETKERNATIKGIGDEVMQNTKMNLDGREYGAFRFKDVDSSVEGDEETISIHRQSEDGFDITEETKKDRGSFKKLQNEPKQSIVSTTAARLQKVSVDDFTQDVQTGSYFRDETNSNEEVGVSTNTWTDIKTYAAAVKGTLKNPDTDKGYKSPKNITAETAEEQKRKAVFDETTREDMKDNEVTHRMLDDETHSDRILRDTTQVTYMDNEFWVIRETKTKVDASKSIGQHEITAASERHMTTQNKSLKTPTSVQQRTSGGKKSKKGKISRDNDAQISLQQHPRVTESTDLRRIEAAGYNVNSTGDIDSEDVPTVHSDEGETSAYQAESSVLAGSETSDHISSGLSDSYTGTGIHTAQDFAGRSSQDFEGHSSKREDSKAHRKEATIRKNKGSNTSNKFGNSGAESDVLPSVQLSRRGAAAMKSTPRQDTSSQSELQNKERNRTSSTRTNCFWLLLLLILLAIIAYFISEILILPNLTYPDDSPPV